MHEGGLFSVTENYNNKNKKKKNNNFIKLIIGIFIIIFIGSIIIIYNNISTSNINNTSYNNKTKLFINTSRDICINTVDNVSKNIKPYINEIPNYRNTYGNNNIMGRLVVSGLGIDTMVVRGSDNSYYLNNNLYNVYDGIGAPFFDFRNTDLSNAKQINIYGHNSQNTNILDKLPLSKLTNYSDQSVFNNNSTIDLYTDYEHIIYEVIGIKIIEKDNNLHMTINFNSDVEFINHCSDLLRDLLYSRDTDIDKDDRLLVLQTCNYSPENTLMLVICKEI